MERITITVPASLMTEVERVLDRDGFQNTSEWIRHAMRQQLMRDESPMERLIKSDPRVLESIRQAEAGEVGEMDFKAKRRV